MEAARLLRRGLALSIFMLSARATWYLSGSLSSGLLLPPPEAEAGEAALLLALGSGETSLGGVGGKPKRCEPECEAGVSDEAEAALDAELPPPPPPGYTEMAPGGPPAAEGCKGPLAKGFTVHGLW